MATASQARPTTFNRVEADRRVRHPLHSIRGYIRRYVLLEGAAVTVLYVALCYWLGLGLDYLPWKALSFDWLWTADETTGSTTATVVLRLMVLVALLAGLVALVAFKVVRRIFKEFNDAAVALLLERRYPRELGDRLITAVELADPKLSQKYGYSQDMVDHTIRDAAERVGRLPVYQIFRWKRLWTMWASAMALTVGMYLLVGVAWCALSWSSPWSFLVRFHQTSTIWAERNLLMQSSYWPPSHYIELVRFPGDGIGVPRDDERPDVKARWVRWTVAARTDEAPRGWRPMYVRDLEFLAPAEWDAIKGLPPNFHGWLVDLDDLDLGRVGPGDIPSEWGWQGQSSGYIRGELARGEEGTGPAATLKPRVKEAVRDALDWRNWTVDQLEVQLDAVDTKAGARTKEGIVGGGTVHALLADYRERPVTNALKATHPAEYEALRKLFAKLNDLADNPLMARSMRRMSEPEEVVAVRKSKLGGGTTNCKLVDNRKFIFPLSELKESTKFYIRAGDYWTPWRDVTLVPPPLIDSLKMDKEEPAYLHFRYLDDPSFLKDKRQQIRGIHLSTTSNTTTIHVPVGSELTLTAHTDRKLHKEKLVRILAPAKRTDVNSQTPNVPVKLAADQQTFSVALKDLPRITEFEFEYFDEEGVRGSRRIIIEAKGDSVPKIENLALTIPPREVATSSQGGIGGRYFVITPDAYLLLKGTVTDDHGLSLIQYRFELEELPYQYLYGDPDKKDEGKKPDDPKRDDRDKRSEVEAIKMVMQGFDVLGGPGAYPFYAATYYGALQNVFTEQVKPKSRPPVTITLPQWKRFQGTKFTDADVTAEELERLLKIQPSNRKLLLDKVMDLTIKEGDSYKTPAMEKFIKDQLEEANTVGSFLQEFMDFAQVTDAGERSRLFALIQSDPAEALGRILYKVAGTKDDRDATKRLLGKPVEQVLYKAYQLASEDTAKGFDVKEHVLGIKTTDQKHFKLTLSIQAYDSNILRVPQQAAPGPLPLPFLIVAENELLSLMMADQRRYGDLLFKSIAELELSRQRFDTQSGVYAKSADRPVDFLLRGDAVRKTLRDANLQAKLIHNKYVALLAEMEFNRMKESRIRTIRENVADKLAALLDPKTGRFAKCEELANKFYKELSPEADAWEKADQNRQSDDPALKKRLEDNKKKHLENAEKANTEVVQLVKELNAIVDAMRDILSTDELTEQFILIEAQQRQLVLMYQEFDARLRRWLVEQFGGKQ
jgi:hypothetical protein